MATAYQDSPGGYHSMGGSWGSSGYGSSGYASGGAGLTNMGSVVDRWSGGKGLASSYAKGGASDTDKTIASGGGAGLSVLAIKSIGIAKIGTTVGLAGASSGLIGVAAIAAVGAVGAVAIAKSSPDLARAGKFAVKQTGKLIGKSSKALYETYKSYKVNSKTKSEHLDKIDTKTKQREEKFNGLVKGIRDKLKDGKEIKSDLKQLHHLRVPTKKAKNEMYKLTSDYLVKNNLKDGKLDVKSMQKELKSFAKEAGVNDKEFKSLQAGVNSRVEEHKDNFVLDKNNKRVKLKPNKEVAKEKAKDINAKEEKNRDKIEQKEKQKQEVKQRVKAPKARVQEKGKEQGR